MPSVVANRSGRWEVRESVATGAGPRSRTLATFAELTDEVVARATARARTPFSAPELRRAALRAGAPVPLPPADQSAADLLAHLGAGARPRKGVERLLAQALGDEDGELSDAARAAGAWVGAQPAQRGEALLDLLLLTDRLPRPRRSCRSAFPRLDSA